MIAPDWAQAYTGVPFREKGRDRTGVDCWGLARLVFEEHFGIQGLPDFCNAYRGTGDRDGIAHAVTAGLLQGWERVFKPCAAALVIVRLAGRPWHCGVMANRQWMLHALTGTGSVCERIDTLLWRNRVEGFYVQRP